MSQVQAQPVAAPTSGDEPMERRRIWDLPTRLTHWALVLLVTFSWWSAEQGRLDLHLLSGYAILILVLFRIAWGFIGSSTSRFANFVVGPGAVVRYVREHLFERAHISVGHNPMGSWSIVVMLLLLLTQTTTGLFAVDVDGMESGPLSHWLDFDQGRTLARLHRKAFDLLQAIIALHLAAVLFYTLYKREDLIGAMVGGYKQVARRAHPVVLASGWRAVLVLLAVTAVVFAIVYGF